MSSGTGAYDPSVAYDPSASLRAGADTSPRKAWGDPQHAGAHHDAEKIGAVPAPVFIGVPHRPEGRPAVSRNWRQAASFLLGE